MRSLDEILEEFTDKPLYKDFSFEYTPKAEEAYKKLINILYNIGTLTNEENTIEKIITKLDKISDEN